MNESLGVVLILGIILPPLLTAITCSFSTSEVKRLGILTFFASILSFGFSVALPFFILSQSSQVLLIPLFPFDLYVDALSTYFILLINVVALFASYFTIFIKGDEEESGNEPESTKTFHAQFNLFHFSMLLVPMVDNLVLLWVLIVVTTVFSAPLIGFRHNRRAQEAAWKYIMISSSGVVFALLGTIILAGAFSSNIQIDMSWANLIRALNTHSLQVRPGGQGIVRLSFLLVLLGYGTKAGLFPMHTWLPDGHGEAPSPVSSLLSGVLLKCALYVILRFYVITNLALMGNQFTSNVLLAFGLLSLVIATPFILKQNRFKRVLAYHSLEHMGIITFGFGLGIPLAFFGALLHALNHAFAKALMFLNYGTIQTAYAKEHIEDEKIRGVFQIMPMTGAILALGGLALVGMPAFNIFFSEFIILMAALQNAQGNPYGIVVVILFLISVTLIFAGLVVHLGRILLGTSPILPGKIHEHWRQLIPLGILLILLIYGGFTTFPLTTLLQQSVCILSYGGCK